MEHRHGKRRDVNADVFVDSRPLGVFRGQIKNVSAGGLFIKMKPTHGYCSGNVMLIITKTEGNVEKVFRIPAIVVRWSAKGAGLIFSDMTPNAFYALLSILLQKEIDKKSMAVA